VAERAALVTGGSSGIGLAIARALGQDGHGVTVSARTPDKLDEAVQVLSGEGLEVHAVAANTGKDADIATLVDAHRDRYGRLDVLINNAGVGIGGAIADLETKKLDLQLDVNLRGVYLVLQACITKAGVIGLSLAAHGELAESGVQVTAFCPGLVATPMTDWAEHVPKESMIQPADVAEAVRFLLRTSPTCVVPEITFIRSADQLIGI
jgi:NAD(P)-dependent dehydrogenase (short-subunit alcohol dehydrogenase family)